MLSEIHLSTRVSPAAQLRALMATVCFAAALAGCVDSRLTPIVVRSPLHERASIVAVRNPDDLRREEMLIASDRTEDLRYDNIPGNRQTDSSTAPRPENRMAALTSSAPGHSFAPVNASATKARLGRPIPIPKSSIPDSNDTDQTIPDHPPTSESAERLIPTARIRAVDSDATLPEDITSRGSKDVPQPRLNGEPNRGPAEVPAAIPGSEVRRDISRRDSASNSNADTTVPAEQANPVEPSVLDRLRGLYAPRVDENADRLRRQMRRFPAPFGLWRESDDPGESAPQETMSGSSPLVSGDVSEPRSPGIPAAENPSQGFIPSPAASPIAMLIAELERELAEWPRSAGGQPELIHSWRQKQTNLRLLYLIADRSAESIRIIESLPEEEQEFWQSLMMAVNSYRSHEIAADRRKKIAESLNHLRTAGRRLQPLASLEIRRTLLCERIDGFGRVIAFPTAGFEPGRRILVYVELENFQSQLTEAGRYRSEFAAVIEFMREDADEVMETVRIPRIEDICDTYRSDYYQSFEMTLPALEGRYQMRIRLRDQLTGQTAESTLSFWVKSGAPGTN